MHLSLVFKAFGSLIFKAVIGFSSRVLVEANFEASKPLFLKAFRGLKNGLH